MKKSQLIYGLVISGLLFSYGSNPKKVDPAVSFGKSAGRFSVFIGGCPGDL